MKRRLAIVFSLVALISLSVFTANAQWRPGTRGQEIVRAEYGSGRRWVDVTEKVRGLLDAKQPTFTAEDWALLTTDNHIPNETLRVLVRNPDGSTRTLSFPENQGVQLQGYFVSDNPWGSWNQNPNQNGNLSSDVRINRAVYGVGNRARDVTGRVNSYVRNGQYEFQVSNDTMGGDPAPNQVKTLTVWYTMNGRQDQITFQEGDYFYLTNRGFSTSNRGGNGRFGTGNNNGRFGTGRYGNNGRYQGRLEIERAEYGSGFRRMDVTDRLAQMVRNGQLNLQVTNAAMGGDPARNQVKTLTVWYRYDGQPGQLTVNEGEWLDLGRWEQGALYPNR